VRSWVRLRTWSTTLVILYDLLAGFLGVKAGPNLFFVKQKYGFYRQNQERGAAVEDCAQASLPGSVTVWPQCDNSLTT
jgi:hypothetical protein